MVVEVPWDKFEKIKDTRISKADLEKMGRLERQVNKLKSPFTKRQLELEEKGAETFKKSIDIQGTKLSFSIFEEYKVWIFWILAFFLLFGPISISIFRILGSMSPLMWGAAILIGIILWRRR